MEEERKPGIWFWVVALTGLGLLVIGVDWVLARVLPGR